MGWRFDHFIHFQAILQDRISHGWSYYRLSSNRPVKPSIRQRQQKRLKDVDQYNQSTSTCLRSNSYQDWSQRIIIYCQIRSWKCRSRHVRVSQLDTDFWPSFLAIMKWVPLNNYPENAWTCNYSQFNSHMYRIKRMHKVQFKILFFDKAPHHGLQSKHDCTTFSMKSLGRN